MYNSKFQMFAAMPKVVEKVHALWSDKDPVVILYYSPPYYPHIYINGSNHKERLLLKKGKSIL